LQHQVLANALGTLAVAFRGTVTIAALCLIEAMPLVFFSAQFAAAAIEAAVVAVVAWRRLPPARDGVRFDAGALKASGNFASTVWLAVLFGQVMTLGDKIILSKLLPLELFGLYSIAVAVASTPQRLAGPFVNTYSPYFTELAEQGRRDLLSKTYHFASQLAAAVFFAVGLLLLFYAQPIASLIIADAGAGQLAWLLAVLAAAYLLNALMGLPIALQFAQGVTWIALRVNAVVGLLYLGALVVLVPRHGMNAAALLWLAANAAMLPAFVVMTHRLLLKGEASQWLARAVVLPGGGAALVLAFGALVIPQASWPVTVAWLAASLGLSFVAALLCAPAMRDSVLAFSRGRRQTSR
jgi:O-antigen/teichoic acid export membrane protein